MVLCFAEVAALFDGSGGPYLYARAAFGDWVGFGLGWMLLLSRLTAIGAISNAFASYLGFFWPVLARGAGRVIAISLILGALGAVNYLGVRYGTWVSNLFTITKLACGLGRFEARLVSLGNGLSTFAPATIQPLKQLKLLYPFLQG
jgi:amino acid transporter